jgi:hypothetical protein
VDILANQPYFKVRRVIEGNTQYEIEEEHEITLSSERLCTSVDTFLMDEILDISFRFFAKEMGFFYLHTTKGMYAYTVKTDPQPFIDQFRLTK